MPFKITPVAVTVQKTTTVEIIISVVIKNAFLKSINVVHAHVSHWLSFVKTNFVILGFLWGGGA